MNNIVRSLIAVVSAVASAIALSMPWTLPTVISLSAQTTALIMGGTLHPLTAPKDSADFVSDYLENAVTGLLDPAFGPVDNAVAVYTPEDFFPLGRLTFGKSITEGLANLDRCVSAQSGCVFNEDPAVGATAPQADDSLMVLGYSQSAVIASLLKRDLIERAEPGAAPVSFLLVANSMRPNGGVLMRFDDWQTIPILNIPFPGASPTDSVNNLYRTVDIARQYDGLGGDFPVRPLNLIATLNALLGYGMLHGETINVPLSQARFQGREGDTSYYLIETDIVPLLQPFQLFVPKPILKAIDAPLRVIIEDAYDRDIGPGVPTLASWRPIKDLAGMAARLIASVPVAVDNLTEGFGFGRVLGTSAPGAFGVGGPDVSTEDVSTEPDEDIATEAVVSESIPESSNRAEITDDLSDDEPDVTGRRQKWDDVEPDSVDETPATEPEPEPAEAGDDDEQAPVADEPAAEDGPSDDDAADAA
ncbi:PE-PPE domain-containing protein [Mycobacterium sp. 236(2023)]|uniref:PE-PPE domain-containing protein n=1 Tax=Mycobacterium sp. 236(2023) TaxID=3038163 RepID=UPI0024150586|nr:PE-PPE domain-containing protein [Mycobacterium sp. 236(2023)]MDG4665878.1 PE-PPE domain-containing protein [Mycobacterium sp. 236(2023)]